MLQPIFALSAAPLAAALTHVPPPLDLNQQVLFSDQRVHEIEIEIPYPDWFGELESHRIDESYVAGIVRIDGAEIDSVGIRFKGNSSYYHPGIKKPFRIKYDEFRPDQTLDGLPSLVLNNNFKDPTHLRETIAYSLMRDIGGQRAARTGFANLRINGELLGFYTVGETVNKTFIQSHVGAGEDGNLWKGDPHGHLNWKGDDPAAYYSDYTLETNESLNDWSGLVDFIDALNNTPPEELPDSLAERLDVDRWLRHHAVNVATVNLDAYEGTGHNYYVYQKDSDGRFVHIPWDLNEAFGVFSLNLPPWELKWMSPLWRNHEARPLVDRLLDVELYQEMYLRRMRDLLATYFERDRVADRIDELADLVRPHVYADPNKMYSNDDFEDNLEYDIGFGPGLVFGLKSFLAARHGAIQPILDAELGTQYLFINEILADNETTVADELGDYDDYVELYNGAGQTVSLEGFGLSDDHRDPFRWTLPATASVAPGERLMLWLDGEPEQGELHAPFSLSAAGEELFLFDAGGALVDFMVFDAQQTDIAHARFSDASSWVGALPPTPDAANAHAPAILSLIASRPFPWPDRDLSIEAQIEERLVPLAFVDLIYDTGGGPQTVAMTESGGVWSAQIPGQPLGTLIELYVRAEDQQGNVTLDPATAPTRGHDLPVFVGTSPIRINEFMADNETTYSDDAGEFDDWIELVNLAGVDLDLSGYGLSDDLDDPRQWTLPAGTMIGAGERLIVWADDDPGDLHAPFKLGKSGEEIVLSAPEISGKEVVDHVVFGAQSTDLSEARGPDGLGDWAQAVAPTPETRNAGKGFAALLAAQQSPVRIGASGGSFEVQLTVLNRGTASASTEAWTAARQLGGGEIEPLDGPLPLTLAGDALATDRLSVTVPGGAPGGRGRYELRVGELGGVLDSADGVEVIKSQ